MHRGTISHTKIASILPDNPESPVAKKFIKRYMPDHHKIRNHKHLSLFGALLHDPNLWHLNRRSVAGAFAMGLFNAFVPVPFQMLLSAAGAIIFRVNLPIAVGLVWITNPLTMPPIFYFSYLVGTWVLGTPVTDVEFAISWEWITAELSAIWKPFLLGCFICGSVAASSGYLLMRGFWRFIVVRDWKARRRQRARAQEEEKNRETP
ncbi:MAG: DUF2062 domain-containing protein [Gammaproteobacteria bacterium]